MVRNNYSTHFLLLSTLYVLGNACIAAPYKNANEFNFLAFMIVGIILPAVCGLAYFIPINKITVMPLSVLSVYCIADAFITFIKFISGNLLPESPRILIILPVILILLYIGFQKTDMLLKFSLISGVLSLLIIILFFVSTAKDFNIKNIYIYKLPDVGNLWEQTLPYIKSLVLPAILLSVFAKGENIKKRTLAIGVVMGVIGFGVCLLNSVLLFGIRLSGVLDYPYSSAGSVVTFGYLFTRLDGFLYFLYFATCIVKCAVGIFVIKKSREKLFP